MRACILCIGTELTRGEIHNTNATWLAEQLADLGADVIEVATIPDHRDLIRNTLVRLAHMSDLVVSTGGLGPTTDDITAECVAAVCGVPLERDAESYAAIEARMKRVNRTMAASNAKQADFPRGATVLPNRNGTAPGFSVELGGGQAYFLPGVPSEMKPMFTEVIAPAVAERVVARIHQVRIKTFGLPESTVNDRLAGLEDEFGVTLGYRAHFPEIEVKVLARGNSLDAARAKAAPAAEEVQRRLADVVYGTGADTLVGAVAQLMRARGLTLGAAESCTGGLVSELVTAEPGASDYFLGAIVSYDNAVKTRVLGVPQALLERHGAVSREVAEAMAIGARRVLGADVALALTGIAGPGGGSEEKPVGTVHYAAAHGDRVEAGVRCFPGTRPQIRMVAAFAGLTLVRKMVGE